MLINKRKLPKDRAGIKTNHINSETKAQTSTKKSACQLLPGSLKQYAVSSREFRLISQVQAATLSMGGRELQLFVL